MSHKKNRLQHIDWHYAILIVAVLVTVGTTSITYLTYPQKSGCSNCVYASPLDTSSVLEDKQSFWINFLINHPTYAPGWVRLAYLYAQSNEPYRAQSALIKAVQLTPNNEEISSVRNILH
jgi:hypothetical protein